jgi:hypothetical protein
MLVPILIAGGSDENASRPLSKQTTRNFWPRPQSKKSRSPYTLNSFYGHKLFKAQSGTKNRGMLENQGVLYRVLDESFYSVDGAGTHTLLGTIPGSNRCTLRALGSSILIVNGGGKVYIWDGTTLSLNASANLGSPRGVAVINNQAIYDRGSGQIFDVSNAGLPATINGLNYASAESYPDNLLVPYGWRETLYLFGEQSTELWWNSGTGNPPFDKVQGSGLGIGLGAIHSIAETPDNLYFLGSDRQFHGLTPGTSTVDTVINLPTLARELEDYLVVSDCIGWTMQLEGQWFYAATFPTQDITWAYPVGGEFFEWGVGSKGRCLSDSYAKAFNRHLAASSTNGDLYELDADTYTDAGAPVIRTRDSAPIYSGLIGAEGKEFEINSLELSLETGVGLLSGQGSDPRVMVSVSRDGGRTFGTERMLRAGRLGEYTEVKTGPFGRFKSEAVLRFRVSDPIAWTLYSAVVDMEICV